MSKTDFGSRFGAGLTVIGAQILLGAEEGGSP